MGRKFTSEDLRFSQRWLRIVKISSANLPEVKKMYLQHIKLVADKKAQTARLRLTCRSPYT
jgi:hypothetical protein